MYKPSATLPAYALASIGIISLVFNAAEAKDYTRSSDKAASALDHRQHDHQPGAAGRPARSTPDQPPAGPRLCFAGIDVGERLAGRVLDDIPASYIEAA
jgi:hypothetical protein